MDKPRDAGFKKRPVCVESGGAHRSHGHAVIALDTGNDLRLSRLPAHLPVGARHLDAALGRLATAAGEEEPIDRRVGQCGQLLGEFDGLQVRATGITRDVGEGVCLGACRLGEFRSPVASQNVPQPRKSVDVLVAVGVG